MYRDNGMEIKVDFEETDEASRIFRRRRCATRYFLRNFLLVCQLFHFAFKSGLSVKAKAPPPFAPHHKVKKKKR